MRKSFSDEIAKETARDEEYRRMEMPMQSGSGLDAFDDLAPPAAGRAAANVSDAARRPPPKRTMMGMGAVPPPPPRTSGAPPPPPPPRASRPSMPGVRAPTPEPPPPAQAGPGATLDMDWDDEELSTQIYDKPESGQAMLGGPTMPDPMSAPTPGPTPGPTPRPRTSTPPPIAGPPAPAPRPQFPPPSGRPPSGRTGAPSPFIEVEPRSKEPTIVARDCKQKGMGGVILAAVAGLVVLAVVGIAAWVVFFPKDPGTIHLTTSPGDPVVLFDEVRVPATASPFVIANVEPDVMHLLEVSKPGFRTWSMQVEVQPGQTLALPPVELEPTEGGSAVAGEAAEGGTGFALETDPRRGARDGRRRRD